jgi:hypothetical protein
MRTRYFGIRFHLGPFYAGEVWRFRKRRQRERPYWYGYLPDGSRCPHHHTREDTAEECTRKAAHRGF